MNVDVLTVKSLHVVCAKREGQTPIRSLASDLGALQRFFDNREIALQSSELLSLIRLAC